MTWEFMPTGIRRLPVPGGWIYDVGDKVYVPDPGALHVIAAGVPLELQPQPAPANPPRGAPAWPIAYQLAARAGASRRLLDLMRARDQQGIAKYGVPLCLHDGRDTSLDALQEAIDLCVYAAKAGMETTEADAPGTLERWRDVAIRAAGIADEILTIRGAVVPAVECAEARGSDQLLLVLTDVVDAVERFEADVLDDLSEDRPILNASMEAARRILGR